MTKAKALTEEQWRTSHEVYRLIRHLQQHCLISRARGGKRRQRLFACASCRLAWPLLREQERGIVLVAERAADGLASRVELADADKEAQANVNRWMTEVHRSIREKGNTVGTECHMRLPLAYALQATTSNLFSYTMANAASSVVSAVASWRHAQGRPLTQTDLHEEQRRFADLLRDIFRAPFRDPPPFDRAALAPRGSPVERVARTIYDEQRWNELPVLADALEESGCADADLLTHCRAPMPHARGCWAVDLILGIT